MDNNRKYIITNEQGELLAEVDSYAEAIDIADGLDGNTFIDSYIVK